jgi:hypothetical protein
MDAALSETVEVELGAREVDRGVQPEGQRLVGERIDEGRSLCARRLRLRNLAAQARAPSEYGGGAGGQRRVLQRPGDFS